jgi:hypothetical protein
MYSRELFDVLVNLKQLLGIEGDDVVSSSLQHRLENMIMASTFLSEEKVVRFRDSKKADGRFEIY